MMRKIAFFFLALAVFAAASQAQEKITVAAFEYPPIYQNASDKGLSCELVAAAFKAAGYDAEFQFFPVTRMVTSVSEGQAACGIGGAVLFQAADIAPNVSVVTPVNFVNQVFLYDARKFPSGLPFKGLEEMAKYRIGVLNGSGIMKFLEKTKDLKLEPNSAHDGTARQLQMGRVDVWAIVDLTGVMYMKQLFPDEAASFKYTKYFNRGDVSLVASKKADPSGKVAAKFKEGLAAIKKDGTYMRIMAKYYGGKDAINRDALTDDMR
jgi:polar amino acid transport system substrate-binding protein